MFNIQCCRLPVLDGIQQRSLPYSRFSYKFPGSHAVFIAPKSFTPPQKKKHTEKLCQEKKKSFFPILLCLFALHSDSHKPITLPTCSAACAVGAECSQAGPTTPWSILLSSPVTRQVASMEDTKQHTENEAVIWNPGFLPSLAKLQETSRAFVSLQWGKNAASYLASCQTYSKKVNS